MPRRGSPARRWWSTAARSSTPASERGPSHLAQRGAGKRVDADDLLGCPPRRQLGLDRVAHRVEGRRVALDERDDAMAPFGVGEPGDADVTDAGEAPEDPLHRVRPNLLAAGDDHVADAAVDLDATVGHDVAGVTGR